MRHKHILFGLILILLCTTSAFSQGDYLEKGRNGIGISFGFSSNSDASGIGGNFGFKLSENLDIGISIAWVSYSDLDLNSNVFAPSITFYALKQEQRKSILSIAFGLGYELDSYSGDYLGVRNWEMYGNYFAFGINVFSKIKTVSLVSIQPNCSITHITGTTEIRDRYGNTESEGNNITSFGFGISIFFETSPKSIIRFDPRISITEDYTTFAISLGVILPTNAN